MKTSVLDYIPSVLNQPKIVKCSTFVVEELHNVPCCKTSSLKVFFSIKKTTVMQSQHSFLLKTTTMKFFILLPLILCFTSAVFGQQGVSISISGTNPDNSAMFDVQSTSKGMLVPRMTEAQRNAIASPATSLLIYQTDGTAGFYYYDGSAWTTIAAGGGGGSDKEYRRTTTIVGVTNVYTTHPEMVFTFTGPGVYKLEGLLRLFETTHGSDADLQFLFNGVPFQCDFRIDGEHYHNVTNTDEGDTDISVSTVARTGEELDAYLDIPSAGTLELQWKTDNGNTTGIDMLEGTILFLNKIQ